jgi:uncharacterized protein (TIGR02271 family)
MTWLSQLEVGMPVVATDGPVGSVASVPRVDLGDPSAPAEIIVLASGDNAGPGVEEFLRLRRDMIARVQGREIYLNVARRDVPRASAAVAAAHRLNGGEERLTIPLVEEQLDIATRVVELGHVTVRKKVDEFLDERAVTLRHQEVEVERVPVDQLVPELIQPYMDGDVYVVPVIEEEVVIERRLRLKEELRIRRVLGQHDETLQTPFRRERVSIEEHWLDGRQSTTPPAPEPPTVATPLADADHPARA